MKKLIAGLVFALAGLAPLQNAHADITVGVVLSLTGPGAALGIPQRNTVDLLPREIAGQKVRYVVLDDATDSTAAVRAAQKLVMEEKADVLIGTSTTPTTLALLDTMGSSSTPMVSLAASDIIIQPQEGLKRWAFKLVPSETLMMAALGDDMKRAGVKRVASIGFATSFGEAFMKAMEKAGNERGIETVVSTTYNPADASVTPQVLRMLATKPDAVFIAGSGTPGITPVLELRRRGYTGLIYTDQGIAVLDVLRLGGTALDGIIFEACPVLVAEQLPADNPIKKEAMAYVTAFESRFGAESRSPPGASAWDAFLLIQNAVPEALKKGQPGTEAFRTGLRDAMERTKDLVGTEAIFNMSPTDHAGMDRRSLVTVSVKNAHWTLLHENQ